MPRLRRPGLAGVIGMVLVEAHYRRPVLLYLTREFDDAYRVGARVDRPLRLRSLIIEPASERGPGSSGGCPTSGA